MKELKGFRRVTPGPHERKRVEFPLAADALSYWNESAGKFEVESDEVKIAVGGSSADARLSKVVHVPIMRP